MYPLLRLSWTSQSIFHAISAPTSEYRKHRRVALAEQVPHDFIKILALIKFKMFFKFIYNISVYLFKLGLLAHWSWVLLQLWLLPNFATRLLYFLISQMGAGLCIALVVSYNHNSVPKFPEHSGLLNNFAALHLLTTRNMRSSKSVQRKCDNNLHVIII
jgi:hypothetical protein